MVNMTMLSQMLSKMKIAANTQPMIIASRENDVTPFILPKFCVV